MMGFGMLGGVLVFWVLIIVLTVLLLKGLFNSNSTRSGDYAGSAKQILNERYARGETNQEQYQTIMKDFH